MTAWGDLDWGDFEWGGAQAWGARENGDPSDVDSPLVEIPPGSLEAVQSCTDRLWKQYESTVTWPDLMAIVGEAFGELDVTLSKVDLMRYRSTAEGAQLEEVGAIVGRARGSLSSDADYRLAILVDAATLFASGTLPEIIELAQALSEGLAGQPEVEVAEFYPATFRVRIPDLDADTFALLVDILGDVPPAAVGALLSTYDSSVAGGWSSVYAPRPTDDDGLVFRPSLATLVDPVSSESGTADGTTYAPTVDGRAFAGNTPGDRIDWAGIADFGDAPFTLSCWVNPDGFPNEMRLWSTQYASLSGSHFLSLDTSGRVRLFCANATGAHLDVRSAIADALSSGAWQHVCVTVDGTNTAAGVVVYIDGEAVSGYDTAVDGGGAQRATDHVWSLGGREAIDTVNFDGVMSDFRAWSRELEPHEVRHLYIEAVLGGFDGPNTEQATTRRGAWSSTYGATAETAAHWATARRIGT